MAKRKEQFRKQQIATVGDNSTKFSRRMTTFAVKIAGLPNGVEWLKLRGIIN